jgi:hypothetical protein
MAVVVYVLCLITAMSCAGVLFAAYRRSGATLLVWSSLCFAGLALNEVLVLVDLYVVPGTSLRLMRSLAGLLAMVLMLVGLILHTRDNTE